jgi:hypothetical protein
MLTPLEFNALQAVNQRMGAFAAKLCEMRATAVLHNYRTNQREF